MLGFVACGGRGGGWLLLLFLLKMKAEMVEAVMGLGEAVKIRGNVNCTWNNVTRCSNI